MASPTLSYTTEIRTFVGEPTSQPGSGYAGYIVGQQYQVRIMWVGDGTVEVMSTSPYAQRAFVSEGLFERWWKPLRAEAENDGEGGAT